MLSFVKKSFFVFIVVLIAAAAISYFYFWRSKKSSQEFIEAKKGNIAQEVSITGRVKPAENVSLAFEKGGKVAEVSVRVGQKVQTGQILAVLENDELAAQVAQADASLSREEAKLAELRAGTRPEDLQIYQTTVENTQKTLHDAQANLNNVRQKAEIDLANLYDDVRDIQRDAHIKADDALNKQIDELFENDDSTSPTLTFYTTSQAKSDVEWKRRLAGNSLASIKEELDNLPGSQAGLDASLVNTEKQLLSIIDFLNTLQETVNQAGNLSQTAATNYRYYIYTGRNNLNTVLTSLSTQKQAIAAQKSTNQNNIATAEASVTTAENSLESAQKNLTAKKAGATAEQLAQQEAQIRYAAANLQSWRAQFKKTILVAPLRGIITRQDFKVGEIAAANSSFINLMSASQFEIEANIAEADIAKVKIGDPAKVTLDTYGNDVVFEAVVVFVDPAETILEGVATYKTKMQFLKEDARIKSGMTANIDILTAKRESVLIVPQRVIRQKDGKQFVLIDLGNNQTGEREIKTGLKGSDGNIEIIDGLKEGEKMVKF